MKTHSFKIICDGKSLAPGVWEREGYPSIGDEVRIFDYPIIRRYVVKRWRPRAEHWEHDRYEPVAIELEPAGLVAGGQIVEADIENRQPEDLVRRLATIGGVATATITDDLHLNLCHADFVTLCREAGLPVDGRCDLFAYRGMPLAVDEEGADWNAYSCFGGFSWEMCCYWVTLPGGAPFVMDPTMLEIATAVATRLMPIDKALAWCQMAAQSNTVTSRRALANRFAEMLSLIEEEIMPAYDGAQELTRISLPSQALEVETAYQSACRRKGEGTIASNDGAPLSSALMQRD